MTFSNRKGRGARYGAKHQAMRRALAAATTPASPCCRCGHPLGSQHRVDGRGRKVGLWHLDHAEDGTYLGFSHGERCRVCGVKCNVSAGARKGAATVNRRRRSPFQPRREW